MSELYPTGVTLTPFTGADVKLGDGDCNKDYVTVPQGVLASKADPEFAMDRYLKYRLFTNNYPMYNFSRIC